MALPLSVSTTGLYSCIRYSTPPNALAFCGPNWNNIQHYRSAGVVDASLKNHLTKYQTLFSYLSFIATENEIVDQFDSRVVQAYWIGNSLLHKMDINHFYYHLKDTLNLKKRLTRSELEQLFGKLPQGALPNHSFHVLNVPWRTGYLPIEHTLETMDECRISWGRVNKVTSIKLEVLSPRLVYDGVVLSLSKPRGYDVSLRVNDLVLEEDVKIGDWVSFHWGMYCDKLTRSEVKYLNYYTNLAINLANEDICSRQHFS